MKGFPRFICSFLLVLAFVSLLLGAEMAFMRNMRTPDIQLVQNAETVSRLSSLEESPRNDLKSKFLEVLKEYKGMHNQKEAVVFTSRVLDECLAGRLAALVASSMRDVWFLHDHASLQNDEYDLLNQSKHWILQIPFLKHEQQIKTKKRLSFDSHISTTKSSFLRFLIQNSYDRAWLLEDDVFYTGPWSEFFDSFVDVKADMLAVNNWNKNKQWWKDKKCRILNQSCASIHPKQTFWMAVRAEKGFAEKLIADYDKGNTWGHHETIVGPYTHAKGLTLKNPRDIHKKLFGTFTPAHWGKWNNKTNQTLEALNPVSSKIYHPVKCAANPNLGNLALDWATLKKKKKSKSDSQ